MAISIAMLKAMAAAGATADMIIAAVEAQQADEQQQLAGKRRKDRERKRRVRNVQRTMRKSADNADTTQPVVLPSLAPDTRSCVQQSEEATEKEKGASLSDLSFSNSNLEEQKESKKEGVARARSNSCASRLPEDWQPSELDIAFAAGRGVRDQDLRDEIIKFRNYWTAKAGKDATKLNWARTWQNWILNRKQGNGNGHRSNGGGSKGDAYFAGIAKVAADISGNGPVAGTAREEIPLGRFNFDG